MKMKFTFNFVQTALALFLGLGVASSLRAEQTSTDELKQAIAALQAELQRIKAEGGASDARLKEIERRIDLLASEVEQARTGGATEADPKVAIPGFGPAASKIYRAGKGVSIGGYGEAVFEAQEGGDNRLDQLRQVIYVGYKFDERILFNSELEFEHATTGEGDEERGEVSVEFAYLDFKPWKNVGLRAGQLLIPVGFLNELHEPPVFHGVQRTEVEQVIIPTTWRDVGAGFFGEAAHLQWRTYVVAGLSSAGFDGEEGIREGRQGGSNSLANDVALATRLDWTRVPGLLAGASLFTGNSGQGAEVDGQKIDGKVTLFDIHAQYERRGLQLRGLYAHTSVGDAGLINAQNGLEGDESVGSKQYGFYLQAGYDVLAERPGSRLSLTPFVRYERLNSQDEVPAGYEANGENDRKIWTAGVGVKPIPNVVLKADYQWISNAADTGANQFNLGIGYLF